MFKKMFAIVALAAMPALALAAKPAATTAAKPLTKPAYNRLISSLSKTKPGDGGPVTLTSVKKSGSGISFKGSTWLGNDSGTIYFAGKASTSGKVLSVKDVKFVD